MPLPLILGVAAAVAGIAGAGSGVSGGVKMKKANDVVKAAQRRNENAMAKLKEKNDSTTKTMDKLGNKELEIMSSFEDFSSSWEKIQNKPKFNELELQDLGLPSFDFKKLPEVSVAANLALGAMGGAAVGTAGGFAAAGATTTAVMALGTASTGTAIGTLSGAAATNATLAALGGGAVAAGGGGMALGTAVLSGATLGVGLLIGGIVFNITGSKLSEKADKAWDQMLDNEKKVDTACKFLNKLSNTADNFRRALQRVESVYQVKLNQLHTMIDDGKTDWRDYSQEEILSLKNLVLLVQVLYSMCSVKILVNDGKDVDSKSVNSLINKSKDTLSIIEQNASTPCSVNNDENGCYNVLIDSLEDSTSLSKVTYAVVELTGLDYWVAQKLLWNLPAVIKQNIDKEEADLVKNKLQMIGAKVGIERRDT